MTFKHELLPRTELIDITDKSGRTYKTPIGHLPSVTTVIGKAMDKSGLKKWRNDIGNTEADAILEQARNRGNAVHDLCERYVMNDLDYRAGAMPTNLETFQQFKPILDESVETVYGLELPLWSKVLRTAGKTDMIVKWKGKNAIVDYKTSRKPKSEEYCLGYMLQGTTYALMMYERYRMHVPLVVVMVAVDHAASPTIYEVPTAKYWDQVRDIFITRREHEIVQSVFETA